MNQSSGEALSEIHRQFAGRFIYEDETIARVKQIVTKVIQESR